MPKDKTQRLIHYINLNSNALGYLYSSLAYIKNNNVIVQRWLNYNSDTKTALKAVEDLLQHADVLTRP